MKIYLILFLVLALSACSTMNKGLDKTKELVGIQEPYQLGGQPSVRFSDNQFAPAQADRQYRRMTKSKMEEDSQLQSGAGSMWVMDGQAAYLFTQNKTRREGDVLNVKIEGSAQKQIETKVSVIKKLIKQLEDEERKAKEGNKSEDPKLADGSGGAARAPASATPAEKDEPVNIENVPTKIVERQPDGNYRVKGQQPFMIGTREYKAIVTGMIRSEDFNDKGVSSNVLLDPQFDVVTMRKKE
jgi:flagellar L-ring protein FlgH